jgi:hypothetical protein
VDFAVVLFVQYRRTCFRSAPNTTTELSVFATVDLASHVSASERGAEVGVVASSVYLDGRRTADVRIDEAG